MENSIQPAIEIVEQAMKIRYRRVRLKSTYTRRGRKTRKRISRKGKSAMARGGIELKLLKSKMIECIEEIEENEQFIILNALIFSKRIIFQ